MEKKILSCGDMYKSIAKLSLGLFFITKKDITEEKRKKETLYMTIFLGGGTLICTECNVLYKTLDSL